MTTFREAMEIEENVTYTENGAKAYKSSKNYCLDLFALGSSARNMDDIDKENLIINAFNQDSLTAMKIIFYIRDIRGGTGERDFFRFAITKLIENGYGNSVIKNIRLIPEYGRWDDLYVFEPFENYHNILKNLLTKQLHNDIVNKNNGCKDVSLLAKWLKSENTSSKESKRLARFTMNLLNLKPKEYRRILSSLRKYLKIVERDISAKTYDKINYENVPSRASMVYRNAFKKNDEERYSKYLEDVSKGEKKINTKNVLPYEIFNKIDTSDNETLELLWKNLPNYINEKNKNALVMADVSASMWGTPLSVSVSTALYFAERCEGAFRNMFITFSEDPEIVSIKGETLEQKMEYINYSNRGYNTNINKAFSKILELAKEYNVSPEDMPRSIFIISDMQFDSCVMGTNFDSMKEMYRNSGYELPTIIFWNVDARNSQVPVKRDENGVILVSGFSPVIFSQAMEHITPEEHMEKVINSKRYKPIMV